MKTKPSFAGTIERLSTVPAGKELTSTRMKIDLFSLWPPLSPARILCKYMQTNVPISKGSILWEYQSVSYLTLYFGLYLLFVSDKVLRWIVGLLYQIQCNNLRPTFGRKNEQGESEETGEVAMNKSVDFQGHAGLPNGVSRNGDVGPERGEEDKQGSWPAAGTLCNMCEDTRSSEVKNIPCLSWVREWRIYILEKQSMCATLKQYSNIPLKSFITNVLFGRVKPRVSTIKK